jgi:hypothetical protein
MLTRFLQETYRTDQLTASERRTARNLRRPAYDLGPLVASLAADPAGALLSWSRPNRVDIAPGGGFEQFLRTHNEDLALLPASYDLGAFLAFRRALPEYLWFDYVVTPSDASLLGQFRGDTWLRRFAGYGVEWLSTHQQDRVAVLELLGWTAALDEQARFTLEVLLHDWHGSIEDAISAAVRLS